MIDTPTVAPSNADQAAAWDGDEGSYWAQHAQRFDDSVARHHARLLDALDIASDARALDMGCGTGQTTRDVARLAAEGSALGVDLSARMIDVARRTAAAEGVHNAAFEQADAQIHPFPEASFDLALGRTAAMFFGDKPAAFANLAHALRPGGQLALLVWQPASRNEWFTAFTTALAAGRDLPQPPPDGPNPFSMADPERVRALLTTTGFADVRFESVEEPMRFGTDAGDAYSFIVGMLGWMLHGRDETDRRAAEQALRQTLEQHQSDAGVRYASAAWLITARRATQVPSATG